MESKRNKYFAVAYKLASVESDGEKHVEEAPADKPFMFISGFGIALEAFEEHITKLGKGDTFDFILEKEQAYGDREDERILDLDKSIFTINGHFDHDNIYVDAIVPLQNEDGNRFFGHVLEISDDKVKMDLNHPLAGKRLHFTGSIVDCREATNEEIEHMINHLNGGCSCGCDHCGGHDHGHCGHDHEHGDHCGCGHNH